ncbi:polyprotein, partial [Phytophthora megakarya]
ETILGYKFLNLKTAQVVTARGGNVRFHEEFTCDGIFVKQQLENAFLHGDHKLPETVPVARIKTSMDTYLPNWSAASASVEKQLEEVPLENDPAANDQNYVVGHVQFTADVPIPTTYKQARASKEWSKWKAAMLAELPSLKGHNTWKLVPQEAAKDTKVITCRWVFAVKRDERGHIKRPKVRLVIHGFKQELATKPTLLLSGLKLSVLRREERLGDASV